MAAVLCIAAGLVVAVAAATARSTAVDHRPRCVWPRVTPPISRGQGVRFCAPGAPACSVPASTELLEKMQLRVGAPRWLCSHARAEGSVWLDRYDRTLLRPSRCTDRPTPARVSGQPGRGGRAKRPQSAPLVGSDDAEGRWAASRRCRGFAPSCGRRRSFDQGRSDLCSRHQQGSCGSSFVRVAPRSRPIRELFEGW